MKIFASSKNDSMLQKFLIPKESNSKDWVEICIDYAHKTFTAKKILIEIVEDEWREYDDYTFPSSLLNKFLQS